MEKREGENGVGPMRMKVKGKRRIAGGQALQQKGVDSRLKERQEKENNMARRGGKEWLEGEARKGRRGNKVEK